ncbi:MAG: alpha/beta fold hydrolase [Acidobacteria bacterium]|uniref:Alpha/beta fold hydrolase n=1 Tax=Candidatus Polarisedimenticola svalbardensis TaxID=2886004 RepID=A0A8J7C2F2_9BACT|nr:alpha/beta fold hydrolase [Candidatus Polarisedimenticola svalbardensis]
MAPKSARRLAGYLFAKPKRATIQADARATMAAGHRFDLEVDDHTLAAWSWGDGPTILLHHGWGGRASQMYRFVKPLVDAGFSVVAYDAPAHGDSPGKVTSLPEIARVLQQAAFRLHGIYGVVSHSFGSAATLFAIRHGLQIDRAVLLAPPADMNFFLDQFTECLGLSPQTRRGMEQSWVEKYRFSWDDMGVRGWAQGNRPSLLVFHDRADAMVPWEHGNDVVDEWGNARLVTTTGLSHRRIREDSGVTREAVAFLNS